MLSGVVYFFCTRYTLGFATPATAYFDELAESFLHGHAFLAHPRAFTDLTLHDGRWYVPFLPAPALLMLPFVAVLGVAGFSTPAFAVVLAATIVGLGHIVLCTMRRVGLSALSTPDLHWLTALWAFGTVLFPLAISGSVWALGQTTAALFATAAVAAALARRPLWCGIALSTAMLARPTVGFAAAGLVLVIASDLRLRTLARTAAWVGAPLLVAVTVIGVYNQARFDSVTELGYKTENVAPDLASRLAQYGQFNVHFLPDNVWAAFFAGPERDPVTGTWHPNPWGMSILLTSPAVLLATRARRSRLVVGLWVAVACVVAPTLCYYNTGWWQFGYRFALDVWPMLLALVALGARDRLGWGAKAAIVASITMSIWGVTWVSW